MKRFRLVLAVVASTIAISLTPLTAVAATPYNVPVRGVEVYATSTEGRFTGQAGGDLPGYWYADVIHTPLSGSPAAQAKISGGAFDLFTSLNNQPTLVTGQFTDGSVRQKGDLSYCAKQTYQVDGTLSNVAFNGRPHSGTGTFGATLTHYRVSIHGYCLIYAASIAGSVTLP